ncbi:MAG: hypothetical protein IPM64_17745 [Phycisphaerales bacterium]|nr:hypothetical protein [Phycisphaerales bacterium]
MSTDLIVNTMVLLLGPEDDGGSHHFRARFDDEPPEWYVGSKSTDDKAVFFPLANMYIAKMFRHKKLLIELTPFRHGPATAEFDLSGIAPFRDRIEEVCHPAPAQ